MSRAAREFYDDWAEHHHFSLYDDVKETLEALAPRLSPRAHLELPSVPRRRSSRTSTSTASSRPRFRPPNSACMKPHPRHLRRGAAQMDVPADRAVMVGDSLVHDVEGARNGGHARRLARARASDDRTRRPGVPTIASLARTARAAGALAGVRRAGRRVASASPAASRASGPPRTCRCRWNTVCPASALQLNTVRYPRAA